MVKVQGIQIEIAGCMHNIPLEEARALYLELKALFEPAKVTLTRGVLQPADWNVPRVTTES